LTIIVISPAVNLSEVLNCHVEKNFYNYVNDFRIEYVKDELANPARKNESVLRIAYDAGFKSKTTFNTLFKKKTGSTPSAYRKANLDQ